MRKKRILYNSDFSRLFTGFGKASRNLLKYLHSTGKYELCEYAQGVQWSNPSLQKQPWKCIGTLPDSPQEIEMLNRDPSKARNASYGEYNIEKVVSLFKPDICIFNQDTWGNSYGANKPFSKKLNVILWTTHDSLPLMETSIKDASKTKHYWNWSHFSTNEFKKLGHAHVKTQYPPLNLSKFYPLGQQTTAQLRNKHGLSEKDYVIGFVFRNQLRKLVPNLIEGFAKLKKRNPEISAKLLLVTNFSEGWRIADLCNQYGVPLADVLTPFLSKSTGEYFILPYSENPDNPRTKEKNDLVTVSVLKGITDEQLNEVYNVMDVYCHPATSGACEMPCVEAASSGKIVLTASYSFGEDIITYNKGSIELDYTKYTEIGTQFIKSSVSPTSIAEKLAKVYYLKPQDKQKKESDSRAWALEYYDEVKNCKQIEDYLDSLPLIDWENISFDIEKKNPEYLPNLGLPEKEFVKDLYANVLKMDEDEEGDGFKHWMAALKNGVTKQQVADFFKKTAIEENMKLEQKEYSSLIDFDRPNKRLLLVLKESIGDHIMFSSLLPLIQEKYAGYDIYLACDPRFFEIYAMSPYLHKTIPYIPAVDNEMFMTGFVSEKQLFDSYINVAIETQKLLNYLTSK